MRAIIIRMLSVAVAILPFVVLEAVLRLADYPADAQEVPSLSASGVGHFFTLNETGDAYQIDPVWHTHFCPAEFRAIKGPETHRIFVVGGSTVAGRPYQTQTAFSSWLKIGLSHVTSNHRWEVINCGGISYASYRLVPIVREALTHQPDAIVVYTGNNEFLERSSFFRRERPSWSILQPVKRLRIVRLATMIVRDAQTPTAQENVRDAWMMEKVDALLDHQGSLADYERDVPSRAAATQRLGDSLRHMIQMCKTQSVPIVVCCPAVNQVDCPPFKSLCREPTSGALANRLEVLVAQSRDADLSLTDRLACLTKAQAIDPLNPSVAYRCGRLMLEMGDIPGGSAQLQQAIDWDLCPLRCRSAMQQTIRDIANDQQVILADVAALFGSLRDDGLIGENIMVDHVHPSIYGHQLIARLLMEKLAPVGMLSHVPEMRELKRPFAQHLTTLDESYFARGRQRLAGLKLWAAGRAGASDTAPEHQNSPLKDGKTLRARSD